MTGEICRTESISSLCSRDTSEATMVVSNPASVSQNGILSVHKEQRPLKRRTRARRIVAI